MTAIPDSLDAWTLEQLAALLEQSAFENDRLEWKEQLPRDDESKRRLRVTMASFANASGGFILFGIKDSSAVAADRIVGLAPDLELAHQLGALAARCEPIVEFSARNPPLRLPDGRVVHVVHVPASRRRPHGVIVNDAWRFPIRGVGGIRRMTWEELRDSFTDVRTRRRMLMSLRHEIDRLRELGESVNRLSSPNSWRYAFQRQAVREFGRVFDCSQLDRLVVDTADEIARDPTLNAALSRIRELAKEWDAGAGEFATLTRLREPTEDEILARGTAAGDFGFNVHHATHEALRSLDVMLTSA